MTEEFMPLAKRNQSLGLKAKAFFFCKKGFGGFDKYDYGGLYLS